MNRKIREFIIVKPCIFKGSRSNAKRFLFLVGPFSLIAFIFVILLVMLLLGM